MSADHEHTTHRSPTEPGLTPGPWEVHPETHREVEYFHVAGTAGGGHECVALFHRAQDANLTALLRNAARDHSVESAALVVAVLDELTDPDTGRLPAPPGRVEVHLLAPGPSGGAVTSESQAARSEERSGEPDAEAVYYGAEWGPGTDALPLRRQRVIDSVGEGVSTLDPDLAPPDPLLGGPLTQALREIHELANDDGIPEWTAVERIAEIAGRALRADAPESVRRGEARLAELTGRLDPDLLRDRAAGESEASVRFAQQQREADDR